MLSDFLNRLPELAQQILASSFVAVIGAVVSIMFALAARTIQGWTSKRKERPLEERVNTATDALKNTARIVSDLQREIELRISRSESIKKEIDANKAIRVCPADCA